MIYALAIIMAACAAAALWTARQLYWSRKFAIEMHNRYADIHDLPKVVNEDLLHPTFVASASVQRRTNIIVARDPKTGRFARVQG